MKLEEKHMEELGFELGEEGFYDHTEIPLFSVLFHDRGIAVSLRSIAMKDPVTLEDMKDLVRLANAKHGC